MILSQAFFAKEELVFSVKRGLLVIAQVVYIGNRLLLCSLDTLISKLAPNLTRCCLTPLRDPAHSPRYQPTGGPGTAEMCFEGGRRCGV